MSEGHAKWLAALLRQLEASLREHALTFGECLFRLPASGAEMRVGGIGGLLVLYVVFQARRQAIILNCSPPRLLGL